MPRIKEKALTTELAKRGFESVSVKRELPGGRVEVEANKLHPVHVEAGESIYAPIPVSLSSSLTRAVVSSRSLATRRIQQRSRMPRATSKRCVTADSWPPLEDNSRPPE
jgi:hypothetical protein